MKMFNLNRKSNIVGRLIAGLLICVIIALSMPEIEVEADDDDRPSSVTISAPGDYNKSVDVYADSNNHAVVNFDLSGSYHCTGVSPFDDCTMDSSKVEFGNIGRGTVKTYTASFDYTHMDSTSGNVGSVSIVVHGQDKMTPNLKIEPLSDSIVYGTIDDYSEISPESFVSITKVTDSSANPIYKKDGIDITAQKSNRPMEPGVYEVTLDCSDAVDYKPATASATFTVSKYSPTLTIPDVNPGETPHPTYSVAYDGEIKDCSDGMGMEYGAVVVYKGENDADYDEVVPTEVGIYTAKIEYDSQTEVLNNPAITTFKIQYLEGSGKVTVADTVYGEKVLPVAESSTNDVDGVEFYFKKNGADDSTYTKTTPSETGDYICKAVFPITGRYNKYEAECSFSIFLLKGSGKVTVADTVYGESSVKPKAESDTNDADKAEFFYKVKNTEDSTYTKEPPKKPGKYVCKAVFPKTGSYDECTATCEFVIEKAKGAGTLTASDIYVGMDSKVTPVSATNGVTAVTYKYKEKGADDSKYTDKVPTEPGEYIVKATFAATDYYLETSATAGFKTSYMPAPTFGLSGTQGKKNFYTDTVTIKAPAGYEVSLSYGKDYKDSINILDGVKYVYFKDKATGALSDKAAVPSYKMDSLLPVVKGVKNNDTIFKDEYELEITDDYLEMVKVNDQTVPVKDGKATYKLTSDSGEMLYKIEATDQAGHTVTYTITVASPWVEDGFVPAGQIVKLKPGKAYSLKSGKKYKIKGDDTVYNGGSKFYVDKETSLELEEVQ